MNIRQFFAALCGLTLAIFAGAAEASVELTATFVGNDAGTSASWKQSSDPVVNYSGYGLTYDQVSDGTETSGSHTDSFSVVDYFNFGGGGFETQGFDGVHGFGSLIFSGTIAAPHFDAGTYALDEGVLTLSAAPEPATWALFLTGFGLTGASLRRVRRVDGVPAR